MPVFRSRPLGTMITHGYHRIDVETDLQIARRLGASHIEVLPNWRSLLDPTELRRRIADHGLILHSAHGCWGGQTIKAARVDLADPDPVVIRASLADLAACIDWLAAAGGRHLVIHPGGLSDPKDVDRRAETLRAGLEALANQAVDYDVVLCVENMPPGVHPGSRMADLARMVAEIDRAGVRLAIDTGHANLVDSAAAETIQAGRWLATTHVHDNNGRQDRHEPPGRGTIDWDAWVAALDQIEYEGPIILECIRHLRERPDSIDEKLMSLLDRITRRRA